MATDFSPVGEKTRRQVAGDEWYEANMKNMSEFDRAWQMYVTNINWAGTWSRGVISHQQYSLINLAMLAAAGHLGEFEHHVENALLRTKVPLEQLRELFLHIAQYCGIATGTEIFIIARRVFKKLGIDPNAMEPLDTSPLYHMPE
jgi:alkylhydroperoxidase/carboxymuconolactone decarboxylase family protein YurZ